MDFTGRPIRGYVFVAKQGIERSASLQKWIGIVREFVATLPAKEPGRLSRKPAGRKGRHPI